MVGRSNPDASPPLKQKGKAGLQRRRAGSVQRGERASSESDLKNGWPGQDGAQGSQLPAFVRTALIWRSPRNTACLLACWKDVPHGLKPAPSSVLCASQKLLAMAGGWVGKSGSRLAWW